MLAHCTWKQKQDIEAINKVLRSVGNPITVKATEVLEAAREAAKILTLKDKDDNYPRELGKADVRLTQMQGELNTLISQNPSRAKRAQEALAEVTQLREAIKDGIKAFYNL